MRAKWAIKCIVGFLVILGLATGVLMVLWNAVIPGIFNLPLINFWQALGLLAISKILFKSGNGWAFKGRFKQHWLNKMENMNPEEREKFRAQWEQRCSKWGHKSNES